jgi:6-phosphogluconolactonase/glucosamine-6-phosphate isomerase/deaminase
MTFDFLLQAKKILLLASGPETQAAIDELLHGSKTEHEFPAKKLLKHPNLVIYFCKE